MCTKFTKLNLDIAGFLPKQKNDTLIIDLFQGKHTDLNKVNT